MSEPTPNFENPELRLTPPVEESEILIGRIIDGEAGHEDRARFEDLCAANPQLWRALALRQQEMAAIEAQIETHLQVAESIELPGMIAGDVVAKHSDWRLWIVAISGWAAVIALAAIWSVKAPMAWRSNAPHASISNAAANRAAAPDLTPDEHLRQYLHAPFVLGEMAPTLLQTEKLSDGRIAIRFLRRIEEVAFLPPDAEIPVDEHGDLTKPPAELRNDDASH